MASEFVKKLTIFIFALFFILLHFIFCRFQFLQSILCQWSWILQKIPVEFPTEISDHKSTWLWIFETSKPGILCRLNGLKKKHFRLDQNKWIVWGFWTRKFTNPFFREMWRRNALPTYIGKGPIYHKTLRKVWSGLAVQKIGF